MSYVLVYLAAVVKEDIPALPVTMQKRIKKALEEQLAIDPVGFGKPLRYSLSGKRRLRVGDYRIVYAIDPVKRQVTILAIKHRKEIYE